jgi:hypothetical protein
MKKFVKYIKIVLLLLFLLPGLVSVAQRKELGKAITTEGRRIILYDDGTWKFELEPVPVRRGTAVSDTAEDLFNKTVGGQYQKSPYNKKEWRSNRTHFSIWFNPKKWKMDLLNKVPPAEVSFHFNETICSAVTERLDTDMETWIQNSKLYWKQNYPSMRVRQEEWRTVNGQNVYYIKWQSGDNRTNLQCYNYFAKSDTELIQVGVSTPASIAAETEEEIFRILSGLVLNED